MGAGLGAWTANEIVKFEERTKVELEAQIEESKKANRRRFQGESSKVKSILHREIRYT